MSDTILQAIDVILSHFQASCAGLASDFVGPVAPSSQRTLGQSVGDAIVTFVGACDHPAFRDRLDRQLLI